MRRKLINDITAQKYLIMELCYNPTPVKEVYHNPTRNVQLLCLTWVNAANLLTSCTPPIFHGTGPRVEEGNLAPVVTRLLLRNLN